MWRDDFRVDLETFFKNAYVDAKIGVELEEDEAVEARRQSRRRWSRGLLEHRTESNGPTVAVHCVQHVL